ncbi:hypothetical protein Pcinc_042651 [Petrolisthes cinctipes]|uniref:Uncharacterized protein n=1 Tax=Petrolisthes cinctipes TaxID=88211 RepID=A0AAE1BH25_PETCI|nr:hypothetical protein Pcinc_042651 [Petrolisthes cinctipes]
MQQILEKSRAQQSRLDSYCLPLFSLLIKASQVQRPRWQGRPVPAFWWLCEAWTRPGREATQEPQKEDRQWRQERATGEEERLGGRGGDREGDEEEGMLGGSREVDEERGRSGRGKGEVEKLMRREEGQGEDRVDYREKERSGGSREGDEKRGKAGRNREVDEERERSGDDFTPDV